MKLINSLASFDCCFERAKPRYVRDIYFRTYLQLSPIIFFLSLLPRLERRIIHKRINNIILIIWIGKFDRKLCWTRKQGGGGEKLRRAWRKRWERRIAHGYGTGITGRPRICTRRGFERGCAASRRWSWSSERSPGVFLRRNAWQDGGPHTALSSSSFFSRSGTCNLALNYAPKDWFLVALAARKF